MALEEYNLLSENKAIGISSSKRSGDFSIGSKILLVKSTLNNILKDLVDLRDYNSEKGELFKYKDRHYFWLGVSNEGVNKNL